MQLPYNSRLAARVNRIPAASSSRDTTLYNGSTWILFSQSSASLDHFLNITYGFIAFCVLERARDERQLNIYHAPWTGEKGVQPRAGGGPIQAYQPSYRGMDHGLDRISSMRIRVISRDRDKSRWMLVDQGLPQSAISWRRLRRRNSATVSPVWSLTAPKPYRLYGGTGGGIMMC
jgi:hypothetical protein